MTTPDFILGHKLTDDNRIRVAVEKSDAASRDVFTHDWTNKSTWYQDSAYEEEWNISSEDDKTYDLSHQYIIDTYHGQLTQEHSIVDPSGTNYRVYITVNGSGQTEQDPHYATGGDYTIDYASGQITFESTLPSDAVVNASYWYAQSSAFWVRPSPGVKLIIEVAEVQFSSDVGLTDTVVFETFGYVDVFAPQLMLPPPSGYSLPSLTKISLKKFIYKTMKDYQNAAFKSYPAYPPMSTGTWRGLQKDVIVIDWDYQRGLDVIPSYGMEVCLKLQHDEPFTGEYATATLYCGEEPED